MITNFSSVVAALTKNNMVINDYSGNTIFKTKVSHVGEHKGNAVFLLENDFVTVSNMFIDETGLVHISNYATGGLVDARSVSLDEAVKCYNRSRTAWAPHRITKVLELATGVVTEYIAPIAI